MTDSELNRNIVTAGVYVNVNGLFPFQVGPDKTGEVLGVVRLGGHRDGCETGWECASREAWEEASIRVTPVSPPATYWLDHGENQQLYAGTWHADEAAPILVGKRADGGITSIYLASSADRPAPALETKALLLLSPEEIQCIVTSTISLRQHLEAGGKVVFKEELPLDLILKPFPHLRLLHTLLQMHPEIPSITSIESKL